MAGIKNLDNLLKKMNPKLASGEFIFSTISGIKLKRLKLDPLLVFKEEEGITVVIERKIAERNSLHYSGIWKLITLTVHSDLSAIGFLARITERLAEAGISVNAVSAYYHDHLFVPIEKADEAMAILKKLSGSRKY
ncbi:MAG: ACT domain-containing protein [Candidatus Micrarchaeota archaeon]|nr:ACT domain-containing protein [Candidatus Micrarchaeota archaeon]